MVSIRIQSNNFIERDKKKALIQTFNAVSMIS